MNDLPLVDSHLDLAENVTLFGRDLTLSAVEIRVSEKRTTRQATVSLPELKRGNVAVLRLEADVGEVGYPEPLQRVEQEGRLGDDQRDAEQAKDDGHEVANSHSHSGPHPSESRVQEAVLDGDGEVGRGAAMLA
jgi:hypothetical protein